jgi:hypothetical protein
MTNVVSFRLASGGAIFTCSGCGATVYCPVPDGYAVCALCRWLDERPQIPKEVRDRSRGIVTGENGCGNG